MRAEIIAVGTELLLGQIANTNAQEIGEALARAGIDCTRATVVGDNEERIAAAISEALARADAVIVTGGLGPTQDDVTREAIARATGRTLERSPAASEEIRARFELMRRPMPEMNLRQADLPAGGTHIPNALGTAPGVRVEHDGKLIEAIPGVPAEMRAMLAEHVVPDLAGRSGGGACIASRLVRVAGMSESGVAEALAPVWGGMRHGTTIAFLAGGGEVRVRITAKASSEDAAASALEAAEREVRAALGAAVVGSGEETLEVVVGRLLRERGWSLGCAESLTGGLIGARITAVPGASDYFRGSIVAYETSVKASVLGVDPALLSRPVSEEVARAMAAGARSVLRADVGLAVTGVAGPTEQGAPVGSVFIAVEGPPGATARQVRLPGGRETIRMLSASGALNLVRLYLKERA